MYQPPEPILWPNDLQRPSIDQIKSAVMVTMQYPRPEAYGGMQRNSSAALVRRFYAMICLRVRGMSTPEIAESIGVASHSAFTNNGDWLTAYCRSAAGTATYNEMLKALIDEQEAINKRGDASGKTARRKHGTAV